MSVTDRGPAGVRMPDPVVRERAAAAVPDTQPIINAGSLC